MQPNQDGGAERAPGQSGGLRACVLSSQACASHHRGSLRGAGGAQPPPRRPVLLLPAASGRGEEAPTEP